LCEARSYPLHRLGKGLRKREEINSTVDKICKLYKSEP